MSVRPYRSYSTIRIRGKTFVKRGFFHSRGAWRARNFYKRTFRRRTEQEEEDDDEAPQICDEVGADDEEGDEVEKKEKDTEEDKDDEVKKEGDEKEETDEKVKDEPTVEDSVDDIREEKKSQDDEKVDEELEIKKEQTEENAAAVKDKEKEDIEDMMLSGEWEVMDETEDEDDEHTRKRRSDKNDNFTLAVEVAVPEIAEKLKEITDPLVGLEYIVEIKNEADCTYYSCLLCKRPGRIAALLRHLNYIEHKMRYMERHLGECASAFPRGNPTTFKHEYLLAMEKLCALLGETNERRETLLVTTKDFYMQKMRALAFRAEQLPHMTFKDDAWKKVFEELGLPTKPTSRRRSRRSRSRSRSRERDRRSRSRDRDRRSRSRDKYRHSYRGNYHDRGDSFSYGYRGRGRGGYGDYVPYQQFRYNNYYRNDWGNHRGGYDSRSPYYYYDDRSWNDYRNQGYYHRDEDTRYDEYGHRGRSSYKRYQERESRSSYSHHESTVESSHSVGSTAKTSGAIFATTIKKRPAAEKPPAKKEVLKKTSAADVKKLWDQLTKPEEHKKKEEEDSKSFWDQWLDVHEEEDSKGSNDVTVIDKVSSTAGAPKEMNSDLNSVAELLDKNLTQIMNNYDPNSGPMFPAYPSTGAASSEKVILAQKIAKALTTMGMGKIPQETLVLILQQLGLLPGGHAHSHQNSRAMDNLRKTIVKFDSVSRNYPR